MQDDPNLKPQHRGPPRTLHGHSTDPVFDFAEHQRTYRWFVRLSVIFVAHVAVILLGMAYFLL